VAGGYLPKSGTSFVLVFLPRTGSNYLAAMLDSHPEILCHHELFNPQGVHRSLSIKSDASEWGVADRDRDPWGFLRHVYSDQHGKRAVGFKLSPGENNWAFLSLLLNRGVKKVVLERNSWLHAYTSVRIAEETKQWSRVKGGKDVAPDARQFQVRVEPSNLLRFIRKRRVFYFGLRRLMALTGQPYFSLDYDEIGDTAVRKRLLDFLGVSPAEMLVERTEKQNSARVEDRIANYEELKRELTGTPYEALCP
jgi:LPS sulfotransferase NodH